MTGFLDAESYARAALTYLAEPGDVRLGALIRTRGARQVLDAIKTGDVAGAAAQRAMQRWRVRLESIPPAEEVAGFCRSGIRLIHPGDPEWPGQLADLGDAQPYALWLRGTADLRFNCLRSVAIVGSRAATEAATSEAT